MSGPIPRRFFWLDLDGDWHELEAFSLAYDVTPRRAQVEVNPHPDSGFQVHMLYSTCSPTLFHWDVQELVLALGLCSGYQPREETK